jgi:hypothetical protein
MHAFDFEIEIDPIIVLFFAEHEFGDCDGLPIVSVGYFFEEEVIDFDILFASASSHERKMIK